MRGEKATVDAKGNASSDEDDVPIIKPKLSVLLESRLDGGG